MLKSNISLISFVFPVLLENNDFMAAIGNHTLNPSQGVGIIFNLTLSTSILFLKNVIRILTFFLL